MIEAFVGELFFNLNIKLKLIWTNRDIKELVMAKSEIKKNKKMPKQNKTNWNEKKTKLLPWLSAQLGPSWLRCCNLACHF